MANVLEIIIKAIRAGTGFKDSSAEAKGLEKQVGEVDKALQKLGIALGAHELIEFGKASVILARAQIDALNTLEASAEGLGDHTEAMRLARQETNGMASQTELAGTMATLFGAKLATSDKEAAQLASSGAILTGVFANAGASMDLYVRLLSSGSVELFNNFGLTRQLVAEKQKEVEATTSLTGADARQQAIKLALIDTAQKYKTALSEDTVAAKQFEAATADAQAALGMLLLPQVTESMQNLGAAARWATEGMEEMNPAVSAGVQGFIDLANPLTVFNSLIRNYQGLTSEATEATEDATAAIDDMSAASNRAVLASYASMRGMMSQAGAARELERAFRESEAAAASATASDAWGGQQDPFTQNQNLIQLQQTNDARVKYQEDQKRQEEQAAAESERTFKESTQAMVAATNELGNQISSAVSGAISGVNQDVIGQLLGIEGAEANAGEAVRQMAAVAAGGIQNEWAPALAAQLTGVQDATAQAFVQAFQAGDSGALQGAARQLALNPIVDMFDANLIAQQVEQKLRAQQLTQQLNDKVNALLGEKGLPAVASVSQQVGQAATDTGIATGLVTQGTTDMAASAEAAGAAIQTKFTEAITAIDTLNARMIILKSTIEGIKKEAGLATGAISGMNVPAGGSLVPNEAQRRMGGLSAL